MNYKQLLPLYLSPTKKYIGITFSFIGFLGITILLFICNKYNYDLSNLSWKAITTTPTDDSAGWLPIVIPGIGAALFLLVGSLVWLNYAFKSLKIKSLFTGGARLKAEVVSNIQNFYVQINNHPRRDITFKTNGNETYEFNFFSEQLAEILSLGTELEIIVSTKNKAIPAPEFLEKFIRKPE